MNTPKLLHAALSESIIGAGMKVLNTFKPAQMIGYLAITDLNLALLINFKHADIRWKQIVG